MLDTAERTALVLRRARRRRRRRERGENAGLFSLCCALAACLAGAFRSLTGAAAGHVPGLYGSALLYGGAGGYVLAGVLAFTAGAAIAALCMRRSGKRDGKPGSTDEKGER